MAKGTYVEWVRTLRKRIFMWVQMQGVGAGRGLSQYHDAQLDKKMCSCTDFTIYTVLNWLITMQLCTQVIEICVTTYPTMQLRTLTFRQEKAVQNNGMTTVYHQWYDVTTSYPLLHPEMGCTKCVFCKRCTWSKGSIYSEIQRCIYCCLAKVWWDIYSNVIHI